VVGQPTTVLGGQQVLGQSVLLGSQPTTLVSGQQVVQPGLIKGKPVR